MSFNVLNFTLHNNDGCMYVHCTYIHTFFQLHTKKLCYPTIKNTVRDVTGRPPSRLITNNVTILEAIYRRGVTVRGKSSAALARRKPPGTKSCPLLPRP